MKDNISILGSTGSIGVQALCVCERLHIPIAALTCAQNVDLIEAQARKYRPAMVVATDDAAYRTLKIRLADTSVRVASGKQALNTAACMGRGSVLNAIVGMAGLEPTLCALKAGRTVALANKETLVAAGELVKKEARKSGAHILPVDSEHSAIFQCLRGNAKSEMRRILLTASGGPFYGKTRDALEHVTVEQALRHPNWHMGRKITVDSATMMNKGLELIEAMVLFDAMPEQIEVLIHRESVLHSAVEFVDGGVIAQLGIPDMALPIQYALTFPHRAPIHAPALDLCAVGALHFTHPDEETFSCLATARQAARRGGLAPCVVNAANEAAVALFLAGQISFLQIGDLVRGAFEDIPAPGYISLEEVYSAAQAAGEYVLKKGGILRSSSNK